MSGLFSALDSLVLSLVLVSLCAFCGFPRALSFFRAVLTGLVSCSGNRCAVTGTIMTAATWTDWPAE